jgi:hypothetical protein
MVDFPDPDGPNRMVMPCEGASNATLSENPG